MNGRANTRPTLRSTTAKTIATTHLHDVSMRRSLHHRVKTNVLPVQKQPRGPRPQIRQSELPQHDVTRGLPHVRRILEVIPQKHLLDSQKGRGEFDAERNFFWPMQTVRVLDDWPFTRIFPPWEEATGGLWAGLGSSMLETERTEKGTDCSHAGWSSMIDKLSLDTET